MREHEVHDTAVHDQLRADEARWNTLAFVGIQDCFGLRGPDDVLELRNCTCGSTLSRCVKRSTLLRPTQRWRSAQAGRLRRRRRTITKRVGSTP